jgi:hypothetical protein
MAKQASELRSIRPATAKPAPGNEKPGYSGPPTPTAPQAQSKLSGGAYSSDATKLMSRRSKNILGVKEEYDAFDLVLEYLLSTGHANTIDEASYIMMEMESEMIQSIIESVMPEPIDPAAHKAAQKTHKIYNLGKGTNNPNEAQSALKRSGPQLPGV